MSVILLELNEVNFEQVGQYVARGKLPTLARLIGRHGLSRTTSEKHYHELEPWIQWVTAHTGLTLAEHQVYRLGDIHDRHHDQIWEVLERQGVVVGAISPMNAVDRCVAPAFFMPDPWTGGASVGPGLAELYEPVSAAVNANAKATFAPATVWKLMLGLIKNLRFRSIGGYCFDFFGALKSQPWRKAMVLDRLLADVFISNVARSRPGFSSLFLNAAAHIQHHYMFNSITYSGDQENPDWYIDKKLDPVLDVYELYDEICAEVIRNFPESRIMVATGLHQEPHGSLTFYWRLREHADFLRKNGVPHVKVEPRMSRDFVVFCADRTEATAAQQRLESLVSPDGKPLFLVDNRGTSLFVELIWSSDIAKDFVYIRDGAPVSNLRADVAFVAIKNGEHDGTGYFIDSGTSAAEVSVLPLSKLPERIAHACGVAWMTNPSVRKLDDVRLDHAA